MSYTLYQLTSFVCTLCISRAGCVVGGARGAQQSTRGPLAVGLCQRGHPLRGFPSLPDAARWSLLGAQRARTQPRPDAPSAPRGSPPITDNSRAGSKPRRSCAAAAAAGAAAGGRRGVAEAMAEVVGQVVHRRPLSKRLVFMDVVTAQGALWELVVKHRFAAARGAPRVTGERGSDVPSISLSAAPWCILQDLCLGPMASPRGRSTAFTPGDEYATLEQGAGRWRRVRRGASSRPARAAASAAPLSAAPGRRGRGRARARA